MKYLKAVIWIALAVGLVLFAVKTVKKKKAQEAKIASAKVYKIKVKTMTLKKDRVILTLPYLATVQSSSDAKISTKVAGRILKILKTGDKVKKGEIVAKLDDKELQDKIEALKLAINSTKINIDAKKLSLKNLISTHKRTKELLDVRGASIEQYQNEEDKIALTRASIKTLQSNLKINRSKISELETLIGYCTLRSPIDGTVYKATATQGEVAMPGQPLLYIAGENGKYLLINMPSNRKLKEIIFQGKTYQVQSLNSTFNGLVQYKADVDTAKSKGEKVDIKAVVFDKEAVKVPLSGVLQNGGENYIFIVNKDSALQTKVKILASGEEGLAIESGYEGKKIILAKPDIFLKLISGIKIKE
ncbi:MAG: biotin/lipoyl-binding protein [Epsilonproteobacteria bacterium]|nr:biotin/lipoyl-binding protein [Campylobacterota bacterium]